MNVFWPLLYPNFPLPDALCISGGLYVGDQSTSVVSLHRELSRLQIRIALWKFGNV